MFQNGYVNYHALFYATRMTCHGNVNIVIIDIYVINKITKSTTIGGCKRKGS